MHFRSYPPLVDVISEACLNLVIYYLKHDQNTEAYDLIKDIEFMVPQRLYFQSCDPRRHRPRQRAKRAFDNRPEFQINGWSFSVRMRHYPWKTVHGPMLLHYEAVGRCPRKSEIDLTIFRQRRQLQLELLSCLSKC